MSGHPTLPEYWNAPRGTYDNVAVARVLAPIGEDTDLAWFEEAGTHGNPHWSAPWGDSGWLMLRGTRFDHGVSKEYFRRLPDGTLLHIDQRQSAVRRYAVIAPE